MPSLNDSDESLEANSRRKLSRYSLSILTLTMEFDSGFKLDCLKQEQDSMSLEVSFLLAPVLSLLSAWLDWRISITECLGLRISA